MTDSPTPLFIDLHKEAARFAPHVDTGRRAETLLKSPDLRVVLVTMQAGAELSEHTAPGTITVQPLRGRFQFSTDDGAQEIVAGDLVSVAGKVRHAVHCLDEGAFLLTLAWPGASPAELA
jgi:quercetin dioxygenase-like cupin family protein